MSWHTTSATSLGRIRITTLLPVPATRIGDLTMYISSRGLFTRYRIIFVRMVIRIIAVNNGWVQHRRSACDIIRFVCNVQVFCTTPVKYGPYASLAIFEFQNNRPLTARVAAICEVKDLRYS
ncbi:hypothetical protein M9H77_29734 [Catharanthus roseus]|uniref:Uncharacterized protein n=1 Tax=Catharanthus roseus TaxID=4058 RepID=A0ACB9ZXV3_CATRO|nr:hypothetical protein M9H77_29734 [Catharanthus roseus]